MAFKMKNPSVMKMAKEAGAAMKMKAPMKMETPKKLMETPKKMKSPMKEEKTVKLRTGGKVTKSASEDTESRTYDRTASINKLMDQGMTRAQAIEALNASNPSRKTGSSPNKKTYKQAYAGLSESQKKKYKSEADFINQAKSYNIKKYGTTEPTKKSKQSGISKAEMEKLVKLKKITRKTGESAISTSKPMRASEARKPSKADQIATAKREGGGRKRKVVAAERKLAKAAGDTSKRGDRKRRKADKKMKKAGIA